MIFLAMGGRRGLFDRKVGVSLCYTNFGRACTAICIELYDT